MNFGTRLSLMRPAARTSTQAEADARPSDATAAPTLEPPTRPTQRDSGLPSFSQRLRAATGRAAEPAPPAAASDPIRTSAPIPPPAPRRALVASKPAPASADKGFVHAQLALPLEAVARPNLLGGAVDSVRIPDAVALAESLDAVATLPPDGLPSHCPAVLLDLETTGLSRDAGCVPFMVGLAWHEGSALVVHQWILSRLSSEAAMLREVAAVLRGPYLSRAAIVTYNGASFDIPLLRTRFVRHRLARPGAPTAVDGRPHFDLLVAARRLWKGRAPDCRLSTLERLQLSVQRRGDIHGSEIAEVYWRWIREPTDPWAQAQLDTIKAHNQVDLVSLAGLAAAIGTRLTRPRGLVEIFRAADHHARQQRPTRALTILRPALDALNPTPSPRSGARQTPQTIQTLQSVALLAADLLRKAGEHDRAASLWAWVCRGNPGDPDAHDRLAKHLEHRLRDPSAALSVAARSISPCPRRLARLTRKVEASGAAPVTFHAALARSG